MKCWIGLSRKRRYSYGNPIARRGLSVTIARHVYPQHPLEVMPSHPSQAMNAPLQIVQPTQSFRRIRDPNASRYQPHSRQSTPGYAPHQLGQPEWHHAYSPMMDPQPQEHGGMPTLFQQQPPLSHQYFPPEEAVRQYRLSMYHEPEWGESSLALPLHSVEFSGQDTTTPRQRPPPPPPFQMQQPRGIARFQRKCEIDDTEAAAAAWDENMVFQSSLAIETLSFDPATQRRDPLAASRTSAEHHMGFPTQNKIPNYSHEGYRGPFLPGESFQLTGHLPSDRRHSRSFPPIQIPPQRGRQEDWEPQIPPAPRHQSHSRFEASGSFSFDQTFAGAASNDWEHLRDEHGGLSRFQSNAPERRDGRDQYSSEAFRVKDAENVNDDTSGNGSSQPPAKSTNIDQSLHDAPLALIELPPLRFFNNNIEVDVDGRPISQHGSPPSKHRKSDTENTTKKGQDLFHLFL